MYIQFLVEDYSTEVLINHVMELVQDLVDVPIYYQIKSFKGIGHLPKCGTVLERKTGQLLNDLPAYLKGFDKSLSNMEDSKIIVVLDNDNRDTEQFKDILYNIAKEKDIVTKHFFCIAVKEMEAWLLGDKAAILKAYPDAKISNMTSYVQDSISETWEILAEVVYPGGLETLLKEADGAYSKIGEAKSAWADRIGQELNLQNNASSSFRYFIKAVMK